MSLVQKDIGHHMVSLNNLVAPNRLTRLIISSLLFLCEVQRKDKQCWVSVMRRVPVCLWTFYPSPWVLCLWNQLYGPHPICVGYKCKSKLCKLKSSMNVKRKGVESVKTKLNIFKSYDKGELLKKKLLWN